MEKIDIIIPAFKAHNFLPKLLGSIISQTIVKDIKVYIINDCCPEGDYQDIVNHFKNFIDIEELCLPENGGPGVARQYGIDHSKAPFIIFADADDTFYGAFALEHLYKGVNKNDKTVCCTAVFLEETPNRDLLPHSQDKTWIFGKMFRRSFLEEKNITFSKERANEDMGFNILLYMLIEETEQICFSELPVYIWHNNPNSITKINDKQYNYDQAFVGWVKNMVRDFDIVTQRKDIDLEMIEGVFWEAFIKAYCMFSEIIEVAPVFGEQAFYYCKMLWHKTKHWRKPWTENQELRATYKNILTDFFIGFYPEPFYFTISFPDFIQKIDEDVFDENQIKEINDKIPQEYKDYNFQVGVATQKDYEK